MYNLVKMKLFFFFFFRAVQGNKKKAKKKEKESLAPFALYLFGCGRNVKPDLIRTRERKKRRQQLSPP